MKTFSEIYADSLTISFVEQSFDFNSKSRSPPHTSNSVILSKLVSSKTLIIGSKFLDSAINYCMS